MDTPKEESKALSFDEWIKTKNDDLQFLYRNYLESNDFRLRSNSFWGSLAGTTELTLMERLIACEKYLSVLITKFNKLDETVVRFYDYVSFQKINVTRNNDFTTETNIIIPDHSLNKQHNG